MPNPVMSGQDSSTGRMSAIKCTNYAAHVRPMPGPQTVSKNRELLAVNKPADAADVVAGDLHTATWTASENVTEVTITVVLGATASTTVNSPYDAGVYVCFDATSSALAGTWLSAAEYASSASSRYFVPLNTPTKFYFTDAITRVDVIAAGNSTNNDFDVIVGAN